MMGTFRGCKVILLRADGTHGSQFTPAHIHKIKIGSSINCDIRLKYIQETRAYHCIISRDKANNVVKIKNLSRKHPVLLNGVPIQKKQERELKHGDIFTVVQRKFLWLSKNKSKQLSSGTSLEENTEQQQNPEKKVGRRITCKINKVPLGKRCKTQTRKTFHDFRDNDKTIDSWLEQDEKICEDEGANEIESENKTKNIITPIISITEHYEEEKSFDEINAENENIAISHSMVTSNNTTPLKDITKLQQKNIMSTPKGINIMLPLEASTPFQTLQNKNMSFAKLGKSDSLVWSLSPATLSRRSRNVAKTFTSSPNHITFNEFIDITGTSENTIIKKAVSSSVYLVDLTTPDKSNFNKSQQITPNKVILKSGQKSLRLVNPTIKKVDRSSNLVKKVLNLTNITSNTSIAEKRNLLFLNKSVTPHHTALSESNLSTIAVAGSTVSSLDSTSAKPLVKDRVATPGRSNLENSEVKFINEVTEEEAQYDRTNVAGIKDDLIKRKQLSFNISTDDLSNAPAVEEFMNETEKKVLSNELSEQLSVKELMSPEKHKSTNDYTDVTVPKELVNNSARGDLREELMKTPGKHISANNLTAVTEHLEIPKQNDSAIDFQNVADVKELPKASVSDELDKELKTAEKHNDDDLRKLEGLNTPQKGHNPDFTGSFDTFTNILNSSCDYDSGLNNVSVCTLPAIDIAPNKANDADFEDDFDQDDDVEFNEDLVSKIASIEDEIKTPEEKFDELVGKKSVKKTYSRKSQTPEKRNNLTELQTENIEKWVESVVNAPVDEVQPKPNNNQQILSNRYSNVTPQTSVLEPPENNCEDTEDDSDEQSSHDSEGEELFKKNAITDPIDPHVSFRVENCDLSFTTDSEKSETVGDILDESVLLNEEEDFIIPSTQQQQTSKEQRNSNVSNDSKVTFIVEDDIIIPETQVEVFQGDKMDDVNELGLEMSPQALETNISLVLNGEEEILMNVLVDNNDDDSRDTYIVETQMPQDLELIAAEKKNDSSILFIDDTIFLDKATPTRFDSDHDTDDSVILCGDDNEDASELRRTRSKSETPKKVERNKLPSRRTMGDTIEKSVKISKFQQEVEQCSPSTVNIVKHSTILRRKSRTVSPPKLLPKSPCIKSKSIATIDLCESFDEDRSESEEIDSVEASVDKLDTILQSDISGIEPLKNDESAMVCENSSDGIIDSVFDHLEKVVSINQAGDEMTNKTASQMMVEECLEMDSDIFQNFDENEIIQKARGVSLSPKVVVKTKKVIRKSLGDDLDKKEKVMSKFGAEINDINLSMVGNIDQNPSSGRRRAMSTDRKVKSLLKKVHNKTISEVNYDEAIFSQLSDADQLENPVIQMPNTSIKKIDVCDEPQPSEITSTNPDEMLDNLNITIEIDSSQSSSIIWDDDLRIKATQLHSSRSKSETPKKSNREVTKATRKTMGDAINSNRVSLSKFKEIEQESYKKDVLQESSLTTPNKSRDVFDLSENNAVSSVNDGSSCILLYSDSEDEMIDNLFDNMEEVSSTNANGEEPENKSTLKNNLEEEIIDCVFNNMAKETSMLAKESSIQEDEEPSIQEDKGSSLQEGKECSIQENKVSSIKADNGFPIHVVKKYSIQVDDESSIEGAKDSSNQADKGWSIQADNESSIQADEVPSIQAYNEASVLAGSTDPYMVEECTELYSEVFQNFDENGVVRQTRAGSLSPVKHVKSQISKPFRKTMGDQLDLKVKVKSKFEVELNDTDLIVGDIDQVPITGRRRALSIGNKEKQLPENFQNKTICEIMYEELPNREIGVNLDNQPQSQEIEKIVNETVTEVSVSGDINLYDTFELDESENLFNEDESEMIIPETQEVADDSDSHIISTSVVIIPETQPDSIEVAKLDIEISQPEISIPNKISNLHKLSLNSSVRTPSPKQIKSQSSTIKALPQILVENVEVTEQADTVQEIVVMKSAATRKRRLYSKETYFPELENNESTADFQNNATSTQFSKKGSTSAELYNYSMDTKNVSPAKSETNEPEKAVTDKIVEVAGNMDEEEEVTKTVEFANVESVETIDGTKDENENVNSNLIPQFISTLENVNIETSPRVETVAIEDVDGEKSKFERRVVFSDKLEEKYFEVLSEYEDSTKKAVRKRRPLIRHNVLTKKKIDLENVTKQKLEEPLVKKSRDEQTQDEKVIANVSTENITALPLSNDEVVEKKKARGRKKQAGPAKTNVEMSSTTLIVEENFKNSDQQLESNNDQIVEKKTYDRVSRRRAEVVEERRENSEHLVSTSDEQKKSSRGTGRRAPPKEGEVEMILVEDEEMVGASESEAIECNTNVDSEVIVSMVSFEEKEVGQHPTGRGRGRRAPAKATNEETESEEFTAKTVTGLGRAHLIASSESESVSQSPSTRTRRQGIKKPSRYLEEMASDTSSNELTDKNHSPKDVATKFPKAVTPVKPRVRKLLAVKLSKIESPVKSSGLQVAQEQSVDVTENESESDVHDIVVDNNEMLEKPSRGRKAVAAKSSKKETPVKPRNRRVVQEQTVDENEQVSSTRDIVADITEYTDEVLQKPSRGRKAVLAKPSKTETPVKSHGRRGVQEHVVDEQVSSTGDIVADTNEHEDKLLGKPSRGRKAVVVKPSESDTPIKSRGRRGAQKQTIDETENGQVADNHDSDADTNEDTEELLEKPSRGRKAVVTKPSKTEIPIKSRSRRGAQKQTVDETETGQVTDNHVSDADTNEHTEELLEKPSRGRKAVVGKPSKTETPIKSRSRLGAQKQTVDETENEQVANNHDSGADTNEDKEEVSEKPSRGRKAVVTKPSKTETPIKSRSWRGAQKQTVDETETGQVTDNHVSDADTNEHTEELLEKPSRGRKAVVGKPSKTETPIKSRSRRGAQKQTVGVTENEQVIDIDDSLETNDILEKPFRGRKAEALIPSKTETPIKSRGRRGVQKQNVGEIDNHDSVADTDVNIDEVFEKPSRGRKPAKQSKTETPVKSRGRRGALKQKADETENDSPAKDNSRIASQDEVTLVEKEGTDNTLEETSAIRGQRGRPAKSVFDINNSVEKVKPETPAKSRARSAVVLSTEKTIPAKRGRRAKNVDDLEVEVSATNLLATSSTESLHNVTPMKSTKPRSRKNETAVISESPSSLLKKRKAKEELTSGEVLSTRKETPKISRVTRSRAK